MEKEYMETEIRIKVPKSVRDKAKMIAKDNGETISGFARRAVVEKIKEANKKVA